MEEEMDISNVDTDSKSVKQKKKMRKKKRGAQTAVNENQKSEKEVIQAWWVPRDEKNVEEKPKLSTTLKFITKQNQYAISQAPIAVTEDTDSEELNKIIAMFLDKGGLIENMPSFEFMIGGKLLVTTVGQHLTDLGVSFEATTEVEYFERYPPPTPKDNLEHDDWVSSVMSCGNWLVTGCYDNTVQLWNVCSKETRLGKKAHKLTIPAHKAPVKGVSWVKADDEPTKTFVSCSIDQTALLWKWNCDTNAVQCICEYRGHSQSVECLAVYKPISTFATGSWDNSIKIWNADLDSILNSKSEEIFEGIEEEEEPDQKKARKNKSHSVKTPILTFAGHSESVSSLDWMDKSNLLSCSWDHTIRLWDLNIAGKASQFSGNIAFFSISYSDINHTVLAACADRNIRLYDPRVKQGNIIQNKYVTHRQWVSSVKWSTNDSNLFISGSYDDSVRMWDKRCSTAPLYNLYGHTDKVLSVDWSAPDHVVSGSSDCSAHVYKT